MKPQNDLFFLPSASVSPDRKQHSRILALASAPLQQKKESDKVTLPDRIRVLISLGTIGLTLLLGTMMAYSVSQRQYIQQLKPQIAYISSIEKQIEEKDSEITQLQGQLETINVTLDSIASMHNKIFAMLDYNTSPVAALSPLPSKSTSTIIDPENTPTIASKVNSLEEASEQTQNYLSSIEPYYDNLVTAYNDKQKHMPNALPLDGPISSPFGNRPDPFNPNVIEFHHGIDIVAPYGTPIKATADGTILSAAYESGWGYCITIDHGYSVTTLYAHLSRMDKHPGQEVKRGNIIGYTGNSGRSTGTHLHYGILINSQAVDPLKFSQEIQ